MNLFLVDYSVTYDPDAIGIAPMMWVYIPYLHLETSSDDPGWLYDEFADAYILDDDNFQRCLRTYVGNEDRVMTTTFTLRGGFSYSYIGICADAQDWILRIAPGPTLYSLLRLPHDTLSERTIDYFGCAFDFALLIQVLHTPSVLRGLPDSLAADQVTGWDECKSVVNPGNAGT